MVEHLITALWIGLAAAGWTVLLRKAPLVSGLVADGVRPWACDVCMTLWLTLLWAGVLQYAGVMAYWAWPPSYAIGKWALTRLTDPPVILPPELEEDT